MKKYALIVGVSHYDDPEIGDLNFAADDAREVGVCLREVCGFDEVRMLVSGGEREPDHISVVEALQGFAPVLNKDDLFLFYFAGHGIHNANGSFLLASNSRIRMPELAAVPMPLLQQCLSRLDAAERVLILDACRNDPHHGRGDSDNLLTQEFSRDILAVAKTPCEGVSPATCVLFSCSEGERAYEWPDKRHGAFTWYLLEGIRGAAVDTQGRLTIQTLSRYVEEQVSRWSRKTALPRAQTPWAQQLGSLREITLSVSERRGIPDVGQPDMPLAQNAPNEVTQKIKRDTVTEAVFAENTNSLVRIVKVPANVEAIIYLDDEKIDYDSKGISAAPGPHSLKVAPKSMEWGVETVSISLISGSKHKHAIHFKRSTSKRALVSCLSTIFIGVLVALLGFVMPATPMRDAHGGSVPAYGLALLYNVVVALLYGWLLAGVIRLARGISLEMSPVDDTASVCLAPPDGLLGLIAIATTYVAWGAGFVLPLRYVFVVWAICTAALAGILFCIVPWHGHYRDRDVV